MAAKITEVIQAEAVQFTVNTSALSVSMAPGLSLILENNLGYPYFANGDSPTIMEIGLNLPYQYCLGEGLIGAALLWRAETGEEQSIYTGFLPYANSAFTFDGGLYARNPQGTAWVARSRLVMILTGEVSMIYNPPSIPNASVLSGFAWAKVIHLLPMEDI